MAETFTKETEATLLDGYEIGPDGRVWSVGSNWRGYGKREMEQRPDRDGYLYVRLTIDGKRRKYRVHRLVAASFLPGCPSSQHQLRHMDGNKHNNSATNLAWGTAKDNADDRSRHGRTNNGWWTNRTDRRKHQEACKQSWEARHGK